MAIYFSAVAQGILWSIMGLGLYISFRILRFADLTSEASFTMGAATAATLATNGVHPIIATLAAIGAGMLAGLITGFLTTYFDIPALLASIITLTGLYSINLRIMGNPNLSFRGTDTVFDLMRILFDNVLYARIAVGAVFVIICVIIMVFFFKTDIGQAVIATGDNEVMANSLGINTPHMIRVALMFANGLIALSGALVAQDNGFFFFFMGSGTVVVAMSSIVIGEVLIKNELTLSKRLISIIIGAVIYRLILVFVLRLGFNSNDFRLISATVLAMFLAFPSVKAKLSPKTNTIGSKGGRA